MLNDYSVILINGAIPCGLIHKDGKDNYLKHHERVTCEDVSKYINAEDLDGQVEQFANVFNYDYLGKEDGRYAIEICGGDWRHDHCYFKNVIVDCLNVKFDGDKVTEEGVDDSYSAIHYYVPRVA